MISKLNKKGLIYLLTIMSVILTGLLASLIYYYIDYRHSNPPVNVCRVKQLKSNNSGLLLHWSFDKIQDDKVYDISGNMNTGKIESALNRHFIRKMIKSNFDIDYIFGIHKIVKGVKGNAIGINGRQWVSGGNIKAFNTNTFSVSVWVWRDNDIYSVPTIMAKGSWPYFDGWWLTTKPEERSIDMGIAWGVSFKHIESGYELPLKEWHHIAVTMDNVNHEIQFYIDGLPYGEKHKNVPEWIVNWNHKLFVGDYDGSGRWPWEGKLDEVRYYNKILNDREVLQIYNEDHESLLSYE
jgi:hypothetical protein